MKSSSHLQIEPCFRTTIRGLYVAASYTLDAPRCDIVTSLGKRAKVGERARSRQRGYSLRVSVCVVCGRSTFTQRIGPGIWGNRPARRVLHCWPCIKAHNHTVLLLLLPYTTFFTQLRHRCAQSNQGSVCRICLSGKYLCFGLPTFFAHRCDLQTSPPAPLYGRTEPLVTPARIMGDRRGELGIRHFCLVTRK